MQWPLMVESDSVFFKLSAKRKANSWISYHLSKRYQTLKKTKANVIKLSGTHWQPTNTCTVWHLLTSPGSARTALRRRRSHTLAFCRSTQTVRPPHVYIDVWCTGVFLIEPVVLECSSPSSSVIQPSPSASSDNPWKLIFSTTILIDSVSLSFCTFIGFLQLRHRTRFRDSFCLASVFKCMFTYLLTITSSFTLFCCDLFDFFLCFQHGSLFSSL